MNTKSVASKILEDVEVKEIERDVNLTKYDIAINENTYSRFMSSRRETLLYKGELSKFVSQYDAGKLIQCQQIIPLGKDLYVIYGAEHHIKLFSMYMYNSFCLGDRPGLSKKDFICFENGSDELFDSIYGIHGIPEDYDPMVIKRLYNDLPFDINLSDGGKFTVETVDEVVQLLDKGELAVDRIRHGGSVKVSLQKEYSKYSSSDKKVVGTTDAKNGIYLDNNIRGWSGVEVDVKPYGDILCSVKAIYYVETDEATIINTLRLNKEKILETAIRLIRSTDVVDLDNSELSLRDIKIFCGTIEFTFLTEK